MIAGASFHLAARSENFHSDFPFRYHTASTARKAQLASDELNPSPNVPIFSTAINRWSSTAFTAKQVMLAAMVRFVWFSRERKANSCCPSTSAGIPIACPRM